MRCIITLLFYSNYDKFKFLYVGGSYASTLECFYDCLLDIMLLFCRNKLILIHTIHIKSAYTDDTVCFIDLLYMFSLI